MGDVGVILKVALSIQNPFRGSATHLIECPELEIRPRVDGFRDPCTGIFPGSI